MKTLARAIIEKLVFSFAEVYRLGRLFRSPHPNHTPASFKGANAPRGEGIAFLLCILSIVSLTGCTSVSPWERGNLAKPQMAMEPHPAQRELRGHIYSSREAATGGSSAGGGGCGCY